MVPRPEYEITGALPDRRAPFEGTCSSSSDDELVTAKLVKHGQLCNFRYNQKHNCFVILFGSNYCTQYATDCVILYVLLIKFLECDIMALEIVVNNFLNFKRIFLKQKL